MIVSIIDKIRNNVDRQKSLRNWSMYSRKVYFIDYPTEIIGLENEKEIITEILDNFSEYNIFEKDFNGVVYYEFEEKLNK